MSQDTKALVEEARAIAADMYVGSVARDVIETLAAALEASAARVADVEQYADALQKALTGFVGGGSELFVKHGDEYRADIPYCLNRLQERRQNAHDHVCREIRARKAAEARIAELEAR